MRLSKSKRTTTGVMNNRGFGDVVVIKNNIKVTIPQDCLGKDGIIPKEIETIIENGLTIGDAVVLHKMQGVTIEKTEIKLGGNY
jgi:hypothetical protein